ncbi:MAG TPA: hypothetical protein VKH64_12090 [Candidatus Binatia bacterium]|nr:hypothetical protein [Candidatus Binatia bacterium]
MIKRLSHDRRGRFISRLALFLALIYFLEPLLLFAAQPAYEAPAILSASKILPPDLISGPHHRVQEQVRNDGYLNIYTIDSKFGQFTAVSTAMLRKRVQEINALAVMEQIEGTKEYGASIKEAGLDTLTGMKNLITSPVQTVKGTVSGIGAAFRRAGDALTGPKRSDAEDSKVKDWIGFSKTKREYAYQFGVDVYSDNKVLQDRLDEISWAGYAGGLTWAAALMAVPGGAGIAISVSGSNNLMNEVYRTTPPSDLRRMNQDKLAKIGVQAEVADLFLNNSLYTPREQTVLVDALDQMMGVANRGAFVNAAALSDTKTLTYFRQRVAEMYLGYHKNVAPIESFQSIGGLAAARIGDAIIITLPLDHLVWTETMGRFLTAANQRFDELSGAKRKQLWVGGTMSDRARQEVQRLGWEVQENAEARLMTNADQAYSNYQKPEERLPSAMVRVSAKSVALGVGYSWGDGTLLYQGKEYPFSVSGLSLVNIGVSGLTAVGKVYDLKRVSDFSGNYVGSAATFAVAGGASDITIRNANGVVIVLSGDQAKQSGTQFSLGAGGVNVKLK